MVHLAFILGLTFRIFPVCHRETSPGARLALGSLWFHLKTFCSRAGDALQSQAAGQPRDTTCRDSGQMGPMEETGWQPGPALSVPLTCARSWLNSRRLWSRVNGIASRLWERTVCFIGFLSDPLASRPKVKMNPDLKKTKKKKAEMCEYEVRGTVWILFRVCLS